MNVINIMCCYNEIEYLPKVIRFYQDQGIPIYVADNFSSDGSWEWLNDNNIPCEQFDTNGCFDLTAQQSLRNRLARKFLHIDWIIYGDADEYIVTRAGFKTIFDFADENDCTLIRMKSFDIRNTGETRQGDITKTYFYYSERYQQNKGIERIHRNSSRVRYSGDYIILPVKKYLDVNDGNVLNYGATKTIEQREDVYRRRAKAWDAGLVPRQHGTHYIENQKKGWKWSKNELQDMRFHQDFSFIKAKVIDF